MEDRDRIGRHSPHVFSSYLILGQLLSVISSAFSNTVLSNCFDFETNQLCSNELWISVVPICSFIQSAQEWVTDLKEALTEEPFGPLLKALADDTERFSRIIKDFLSVMGSKHLAAIEIANGQSLSTALGSFLMVGKSAISPKAMHFAHCTFSSVLEEKQSFMLNCDSEDLHLWLKLFEESPLFLVEPEEKANWFHSLRTIFSVTNLKNLLELGETIRKATVEHLFRKRTYPLSRDIGLDRFLRRGLLAGFGPKSLHHSSQGMPLTPYLHKFAKAIEAEYEAFAKWQNKFKQKAPSGSPPDWKPEVNATHLRDIVVKMVDSIFHMVYNQGCTARQTQDVSDEIWRHLLTVCKGTRLTKDTFISTMFTSVVRIFSEHRINSEFFLTTLLDFLKSKQVDETEIQQLLFKLGFSVSEASLQMLSPTFAENDVEMASEPSSSSDKESAGSPPAKTGSSKNQSMVTDEMTPQANDSSKDNMDKDSNVSTGVRTDSTSIDVRAELIKLLGLSPTMANPGYPVMNPFPFMPMQYLGNMGAAPPQMANMTGTATPMVPTMDGQSNLMQRNMAVLPHNDMSNNPLSGPSRSLPAGQPSSPGTMITSTIAPDNVSVSYLGPAIPGAPVPSNVSYPLQQPTQMPGELAYRSSIGEERTRGCLSPSGRVPETSSSESMSMTSSQAAATGPISPPGLMHGPVYQVPSGLPASPIGPTGPAEPASPAPSIMEIAPTSPVRPPGPPTCSPGRPLLNQQPEEPPVIQLSPGAPSVIPVSPEAPSIVPLSPGGAPLSVVPLSPTGSILPASPTPVVPMPGTTPTTPLPRPATTTPASVPAAPLSGSGNQVQQPPPPTPAPTQPHGRWAAEVEEEQSVASLEHLLDEDED